MEFEKLDYIDTTIFENEKIDISQLKKAHQEALSLGGEFTTLYELDYVLGQISKLIDYKRMLMGAGSNFGDVVTQSNEYIKINTAIDRMEKIKQNLISKLVKEFSVEKSEGK